ASPLVSGSSGWSCCGMESMTYGTSTPGTCASWNSLT
ncbi:uncharacterized protein METZ01_LOCUS217777, partial [marine metagenome]